MGEQWGVLEDGVQDTPSQNMAPWNTEYFRLKEFEKEQVLGRLSDLPLKQVTNPHERNARPPHPPGKRYPYLRRQKNAKMNPNKQALLHFLSLLPSQLIPFVPAHLSMTLHSSSTLT